jgi:hypothetical protein
MLKGQYIFLWCNVNTNAIIFIFCLLNLFQIKKPCNCKGSSSSLIGGSGAGWEGTALLHHGSYIKVGCLQFVFSIVDHATSVTGQEKRKEPMSLLKSTLKASSP